MKTTLDLPDELVMQVKLRALQEGRKLKDAVAELLRRGLASSTSQRRSSALPVVTKDKQTGLPLIKCEAAAAGEEMTPERVADILLDQETQWHHAATR